MKRCFTLMFILIAFGLSADMSGSIGISTDTYFPYEENPVFPTDISLSAAAHLNSYPSPTLSFFMDIDTNSGLSISAGSIDRGFTEADLTIDMSLGIGNMVLRAGSDLYGFSGTDDTNILELEPFIEAAGGNTLINWQTACSVPISIESTTDAYVSAKARISFMTGDSAILEPALSYVDGDALEASLRYTRYGNGPTVLDAWFAYAYQFTASLPHRISWNTEASVLMRKLNCVDITISTPGSISLSPDYGSSSIWELEPVITAGVLMNSRAYWKIEYGSEIGNNTEAVGYLSTSFTYTY